ncbi:MAG: hypothetical protein AB1807_17585 [Pseudomonadota bacterium]
MARVKFVLLRLSANLLLLESASACSPLPDERCGLTETQVHERCVLAESMLIWFVSAGMSGVVASTIVNDVFVN